MRIDVRFSGSVMRFDAALCPGDTGFDAKFSSLQKITEYENADPYTGSYTVIPKTDAQTLPTAQKFMADDVSVLAIPYFETSNTDGGETVYIGTEVELYGD